MKAVVTKRGQFTIPKSLRSKLGMHPGTSLEFSTKDGALIARKPESDAVSQVFGCLDKHTDSDSFVRKLRGSPAI